MASFSFTATIKNFIQTLKEEETTNSLAVSRNDTPDHSYKRTSATASEHLSFPFCGNHSVPVSVNTQQYSVPFGLNGNLLSKPKKEIEEIIIIDSDDESDCEVRQNGELEFSSGTKIDNQPFSFLSSNANVQSISISMEGKCNFLMTPLIPQVNSNQKLSSENSGVLKCSKNYSQLNQSLPTENINNNLDSVCSSKSDGTEYEVLSSKQNISRRLFKKLSRNERCCAFCPKSFTTLQGLQLHNKFFCSNQMKYNALCKICGVDCQTPGKARSHIKNKHGIKRIHKLKTHILFKSPENSLPDSISATTKVNNLNTGTINERFSSTSSKEDFLEKLDLSGKNRIEMRTKKLKTVKKFPCRYCKRVLNSQQSLLLHSKFHCKVQKVNELMCKICRKRYSGWAPLKQHLINTHNLGRITKQLRNFIITVEKDMNDNAGRNNGKNAIPSLENSNKSHGSSNSSNSRVVSDENISAKQIVSPSSFSNLSRKERSCTFCKKIFKTIFGLQIHNKYHCKFQAKMNLVCEICGLKFCRPDILVDHIKIKHGINMVRPNLKSLLNESNSVSDVNSTMTKSTSKESISPTVTEWDDLNYFRKSRSPCTVRNGEKNEKLDNSTKSQRKKFRKTVNESNKFQCKHCKQKFVSCNVLYTHLNYSCPFQKRFKQKCKICGYLYASYNAVIKHLRCKHGVTKRSSLKQYYVKVEIENSRTENIGDEYEAESGIKNFSPIAQKISGQGFKCTHCLGTFSEKRGLSAHLRFCQRAGNDDEVSTNSEIKQKTQNMSEYSENLDTLGKCGVCNISFNSLNEIKTHRFTSHNVTKIICQSCNEIFHSFHAFKCHLTTLDGNYVCVSLKKSHKDSRLGHKEIIGEKPPISCNVCNEKFISLVLLVEHLQKHLI